MSSPTGRNILYREFYNTYKARFKANFKDGTECQRACNDIWRQRSPDEAQAMIAQWRSDLQEIAEYEHRQMLLNQVEEAQSADNSNNVSEDYSKMDEDTVDVTNAFIKEEEDSPVTATNSNKYRKRPAQEKLESQISEIKSDLFDLYQVEQHRALTQEEVQKRFCCLEDLKPLEKKLNALKAFARRSIAFREKEKKLMSQILSKAATMPQATGVQASAESAGTSRSDVDDEHQPTPSPPAQTINKPKPAQEKIENEIAETKRRIFVFDEMDVRGEMDTQKSRERDDLLKQLLSLEKKLRNLKNSAQLNQARRRVKKKMLLSLLNDPKNHDLRGLKKFRTTTGRPSLEDEQPGMKQAIFDIIGVRPATPDEVVTINMSLGELQKQLKDRGFNISKSSLCNRFHPANNESRDPKRRKCLPFRLMKPQHPPKADAPPKIPRDKPMNIVHAPPPPIPQQPWPTQVVPPQQQYYANFTHYGQMKAMDGMPQDYALHF